MIGSERIDVGFRVTSMCGNSMRFLELLARE
jgi:hypothetical protein